MGFTDRSGKVIFKPENEPLNTAMDRHRKIGHVYGLTIDQDTGSGVKEMTIGIYRAPPMLLLLCPYLSLPQDRDSLP